TYSPILMSCAALSTDAGFMWLPAPRSSVAPHFEGQRWLSVGGRQEGLWATAVDRPSGTITARTTMMRRCMALLRVEGALHSSIGGHVMLWRRGPPSWTGSSAWGSWRATTSFVEPASRSMVSKAVSIWGRLVMIWTGCRVSTLW